MPKSEKQKLKTLYVARCLWEQTDENHGVSASDILSYLENTCGIIAEEHSIYRDIATLREDFGLDIDGGRGKKYSLKSRQIQFEDLRMIIECIYSARFLSEEQTAHYVEIVKSLCSKYQKEILEKETYAGDRSRTQRADVPKSAAVIRRAIKEDKKVYFRYLKASVDNVRKTVTRRNNAGYSVSPYSLFVNDGNYYLLGYSDRDRKILTYRVDRMKAVKCTDERRVGRTEFKKTDISTFTRRVFGMYRGERQHVEVVIDKGLLDTVVDRLGVTGVVYDETKDKKVIVKTEVEVSPQFYSWVFGFGADAEIINPPTVVDGMKEYIKTVAAVYK